MIRYSHLPDLRTLLVLVLSATGSGGLAQEQFLQFDKTFGGPNGESCADMIPGIDGGFLLVGSTGSYGPGAADGNENGYVVKVDANGDPEWQFALGGGGQDFFSSAAQTSTGDYLVVGQRISSGNILLGKVSPGGDVLWTRDIGSEDTEESARRILGLGQDLFAVVGTRNDNLFILWIDAMGAIQQTAEYSSQQQLQASDVALASDGALLIAGGIHVFPQQHSMLLKVAADGSLVWGRIYQQLENSNWNYAILPAADGGCFTTGTGGVRYAALSRYHADGTLAWRRGFSSLWSNIAYDLDFSGQNRLILGTQLHDLDVLQAPSSLLLVDTLGNPVDQVTLGPAADYQFSQPSKIILDSAGDCQIAGHLKVDEAEADLRLTCIPIQSDHIEIPCSSQILALQEMTMPQVTLGPMITAVEPPLFTSTTLNWSPVVVTGSQTICSNVGMDETSALRFRCFPNPATDVLHIEAPSSLRTLSATIADATGRSCVDAVITAENDLSIGHLAPGVYHCQLERANGERVVLRFVVE